MKAEPEVPPPPEGYEPVAKGPFLTWNGPIFQRPTAPPDIELATFILPRHTNGAHMLHGGMLSAFLDVAMGSAVRLCLPRRTATVHMSIDFMRAGRAGEWLFGRAKMTHATKDIAFAEASGWVGGREVGRATGVFKLRGPS